MGESVLRPPVPRRTARSARAALLIVLALALTVVGIASAAKQPPHPPGSYAGTSSENSPVTFKVSPNGKTVLAFTTAIGYDGKCGQGGGPGFYPAIARIPIHKHGRFSTTTLFKGPTPAVKPTSGTVTGHFVGGAVTGTVVVHVPKIKGCAPYAETYSATRTTP